VIHRLAGPARPARRGGGLLVLLCVVLLVACGDGPDEVAAPTPTVTLVEQPAEQPEPPPAPAPEPVDPLTGAAPAPAGPLVAVKIDNAPAARPFHRGLDAASVVYLELVEGGATRLLALYSQPVDGEVGPIRSFRESDIELLVQHGPVAVGFSGANSGLLASFHQAVAAGQLADASYGSHLGLYRIGERRADVKNFYAVPDRLAGAAAGAAPARDIGWTFDPVPRSDAAPGTSGRVTLSPRQSVELRYDQASQRYAVLMGGQALAGAAPANVLVQQVAVRAGSYHDTTGAVSPYTETVGAGPLEVLRDGTRVSGRWERPAAADGTRLLDPAGAPVALKPGPTWVLLQPAGLPLAVG
jgi:hypothetical protein